MRPRTLSSRMTFHQKFIVPGMFLLVALMLILVMRGALSHGGGAPPLPVVLSLLLLLAMTVFVFRNLAPLKRVRMDVEALYISNYLKEVRIPLAQLAAVDEPGAFPFRLRIIVLRFRQPTPFGESVSFQPYWNPLFWKPHPLLAELRAVAAGQPIDERQFAQLAAADHRRLWLIGGGIVAFVVGLLSLLHYLFVNSDVYRLGLQALNQDAAVAQALGTPLQPGFLVGGQIDQSTDHGFAHLDITVSGPRGRGEAHVDAFKTGRGWQLSHVWLVPAAGACIEVLDTRRP